VHELVTVTTDYFQLRHMKHFSILISTQQCIAHVSVLQRRLSINYFLHVKLFTFCPQAVLQTNGAQRCMRG